LQQQLSAKDFWNEAIIFISKDENLNKAHVKFLENRLYEMAKSAGRYIIDNSSTPTLSSISESDRAEMEEFLDNIKMLVNTLGHKVFDEKREVKPKQKQGVFFIRAARGADAQGEPTSDGFVVFKGSKAAVNVVNSMSQNFINLRQSLIEKKILTISDDHLFFSEDCIFSSPSTAAAVVMGRNANGLTEWRQNDNQTLKDFESIIVQ
jgi:hypothetical protein